MRYWPSIDHSLLSPNGRISKRARKAATEREAKMLFEGIDLNPPVPQPSEHEKVARHIKELEALADRGMSPIKFRKEANRLRILHGIKEESR